MYDALDTERLAYTRPVLVQAPAWAGIGLRFCFWRLPLPWWPADWWQRNYDTLAEDDMPGPLPLTERQMRVPGFPYPEP